MMFFARCAFRTTMSGITFEVVDGVTGRVVLAVRDAGNAVRVARELNSDRDARVRIF